MVDGGFLHFSGFLKRILTVGASIASITCLVAASATWAAPRELQSIVAVVNDQMISNYDIEKRVSLVLAATGGKISPDQMAGLRKQALQSLIDEKLELQEAKQFKVPVDDEEVEQTFARIGQQYNFTPAQFEAYLQSLGTTKEALTHQIRAELAWSKLVRGRLQSQINISDEEVQAVLKRLEDSAGQNEFQVSEIFLIVGSPDQNYEVRQAADRIVSQVRNGAPFDRVARQFSDAATAAVGGDMGWVPEGQLSTEVDNVLKKMRPGHVSDPIRTSGGYYIIQLRDKRKILTADPMDTKLSIYQIYFKAKGKITPAAISAAHEMAAAKTADITSCENLPDKAKALGADEEGDLGTLRLGDLSPQLQKIVKNVEVGHASKPMDTKEGARVLVVCKRDEPEVNMPTAQTVMQSLSQQRLSMMARRYLRDLRRDAIIDYK